MTGYIHMTQTFPRGPGWVANCRCGWVGTYLRDRLAAREEGDRHLDEKNREKEHDDDNR